MSILDSSKIQFIELLLSNSVLQVGDFTLKSGRRCPYFFNLGSINSGASLAQLGAAYADTILASNTDFDVLFGPSYKGIPIATTAAVALAGAGCDIGVAYNRKEAKAHGEGGQLVGADVTGRVMLVDDVLTSGKAIREAAALLSDSDATIVGAVIALDRQEVGPSGTSAVQGLAETLQAPVVSILSFADIVTYLQAHPLDSLSSDDLDRFLAYQKEYCTF